jgi:hypothetical protein
LGSGLETMEPFESTFVLFVDMLGFAALVEEQGELLDELNPIFTGTELYSPSEEESLLGYRFVNFHRCLNEARFDLQKLGAGTAIVFSDCAFFRIDAIHDAIEVARKLMFRLVDSGVPARMGIAQGTFRMLRVMTDTSQQVSFHMSQFLGTGIVRAYKTEQCGLSGLRILLHPNVISSLDPEALRIIPIPPSDRALKLTVEFEVNYMGLDPCVKSPDYEDCLQFDSLRNMCGEADENVQYHYIDTYHAWNRMREQIGRPAYPWEKFLDRDEYDHVHGIRTRPDPEGAHNS